MPYLYRFRPMPMDRYSAAPKRMRKTVNQPCPLRGKKLGVKKDAWRGGGLASTCQLCRTGIGLGLGAPADGADGASVLREEDDRVLAHGHLRDMLEQAHVLRPPRVTTASDVTRGQRRTTAAARRAVRDGGSRRACDGSHWIWYVTSREPISICPFTCAASAPKAHVRREAAEARGPPRGRRECACACFLQMSPSR